MGTPRLPPPPEKTMTEKATDERWLQTLPGRHAYHAAIAAAWKVYDKALAKARQDRDEALAEKRLADAEVITANEDRRLAEIEYRRLSEHLRLRTIKSPVDGIVVDRMLNAGELADNRDLRKPILRLADIGKLHVEVLMPLDAFGKLALGQNVEVHPEPRVGGRYTATVKVIDQVHDAASGTFGVRLEMANSGLKLPAGIKCKASFPAVGTPPGTSQAGRSGQER